MANFFKNTISKEIGTTPVSVLEVPGNARATVIGMSLTNLTLGAILVSVQVEIPVLDPETQLPVVPADTITGYYCKDIIVPANTTLRLVNGGEKLILTQNNVLYISSNADASIDALISYVEIV